MEGENRYTTDKHDYLYGNTVRKLDEREEVVRRKHREVKREVKKDSSRELVFNTIKYAMVVLVLSIILIHNNARIYSSQRNLQLLNISIREEKDVMESLRVESLGAVSIEVLQNKSKESGMKLPKSEDVVTVNITKDYFESIR